MQTFSSAARLKTKADFAALKRGRRLAVGGLRLVYRSNNLDHARLGLAVSRKFGNAIHRNRLKRKLRETFRLSPYRNISVDILVIPMDDYLKLADPAAAFSKGISQIARVVEIKR